MSLNHNINPNDVLKSVLYRSDIKKYQRFNTNKTLTLSNEESDYIRHQLSVRKYDVEKDMLYWIEKKNLQEVERCKKDIDKLNNLITRVINLK